MSDDRNPYPPQGQSSEPDPPETVVLPAAESAPAREPAPDPDPHVAGTALVGAEIGARLAALDQLYEAKQISAAELGEARRRVLAGGAPEPTSYAPAGPPPPVMATPIPPQAAPQAQVDSGGTPPPVVTEHIGSPPPPEPKKILGMPVDVAAGIAAALLVGLIAIGLILILGGGGDDDSTPVAEGPSYATQIKVPLNQLTSSAIATGKALARVSEPSDLPRLNRTADRQLDLVEEARRRLSTIPVAASDRRAHQQLMRSAAAHRRFLVQLGRATSGQPSQAKLSATNRARRAGAQAIRSYRTFFALVPAAPDAITATDLTDTSGLRSAFQAGIASQRPRGGGSAPGPASPGVALTSLFIDPDSNDPSDVCFGPGQRPTAVASLTLSGTRYYSGIVQCGNAAAGPYAANGELRFDTSLLSGRIIGVGGTFGIDEASTSQRGAVATFTVRYGGQVLCQVVASWGAPRSCSPVAGTVFANGGYVTIEQSVTPARGDRGLWAGVLNPTLILG